MNKYVHGHLTPRSFGYFGPHGTGEYHLRELWPGNSGERCEDTLGERVCCSEGSDC